MKQLKLHSFGYLNKSEPCCHYEPYRYIFYELKYQLLQTKIIFYLNPVLIFHSLFFSKLKHFKAINIKSLKLKKRKKSQINV